MKRTALFALTIALLLLPGCGMKAEETAIRDFQTALAAAQKVSFTAEVRADFSDKIEEYTLNYTKDADGAAVEVEKPELLAGLRARVGKDASALEYDGAALDTGPLAAWGLCPVSSLPELAAAMADGHLDLVWREGDAVAARFIPRDDLTVTVWFGADGAPYHAEEQSDGKVLVYCDIINFTFS